MQTALRIFHVETVITADGGIHVDHIPFEAGAPVDVTIRILGTETQAEKSYPLRGMPLRYDDPFGPVDITDWSAAQ
jgi:hypothetical protein